MPQEELQLQKSKLERVEKERNELRLNTDRLESRVGPLSRVAMHAGRMVFEIGGGVTQSFLSVFCSLDHAVCVFLRFRSDCRLVGGAR